MIVKYDGENWLTIVLRHRPEIFRSEN